MVARDGGGDVAPVERVARGGEAGDPAGAAAGPVLVGQVSEGPTEISLDEALAGPRHPSPGRKIGAEVGHRR